jgi:hypothetical protein
LQDAVRSNAQSRIVFRCGSHDASSLAPELAPLVASALMTLPKFSAAARLGADGQVPRVLLMRTVPPVRPPADAVPHDEVIAAAMTRYGREASVVDAALRDESGSRRAAADPAASART